MNLTIEQKETVLFKLGHSPLSALDYAPYLNASFYSITINRIEALIAELDSVDLLLVNSRSDSMTTKLDSIELDFVQHVNHLNSTGSGLLKELSNLLGIPVFYNKYSGVSFVDNVGNNTSNSSFYSYW